MTANLFTADTATGGPGDITKDPTQKLHENHAIFVLYPVNPSDPPVPMSTLKTLCFLFIFRNWAIVILSFSPLVFFFVLNIVQLGFSCVLDRAWSPWTCLPVVVVFFFVFASFFDRFLCRILSGRQTQITVDAGTSGSGDYTGSKTEISYFSYNFCVGSCVITGPTCTSVYFEYVGGYTESDIEIPQKSHDFFVESCMAAGPNS